MSPKRPPEVVTAFRLTPALLKRLDAHARRLEAMHPGLRFTRGDAVRTLLTSALDAVEAGDRRGGRHG